MAALPFRRHLHTFGTKAADPESRPTKSARIRVACRRGVGDAQDAGDLESSRFTGIKNKDRVENCRQEQRQEKCVQCIEAEPQGEKDAIVMVVVSLFIPNPVNISITQNTFIKYAGSLSHEEVGLIQSIDVHSSTVTVRRFLGWAQLLATIGTAMIENITFWPLDPSHSYLCDSDLYEKIRISAIQGIAFVFYYTEHILEQLDGLANVYVVTSTFNSNCCTLIHEKTFHTFPSSYNNHELLSCFPSTLLRQLLNIKEVVQRMMNTRSMSSRCSQSTTIHNINPLTWYYIIRIMGANCRYNSVVVKRSYIKNDEFVLEKRRVTQAILFLTFPFPLEMAKKNIWYCNWPGNTTSNDLQLETQGGKCTGGSL